MYCLKERNQEECGFTQDTLALIIVDVLSTKILAKVSEVLHRILILLNSLKILTLLEQSIYGQTLS